MGQGTHTLDQVACSRWRVLLHNETNKPVWVFPHIRLRTCSVRWNWLQRYFTSVSATNDSVTNRILKRAQLRFSVFEKNTFFPHSISTNNTHFFRIFDQNKKEVFFCIWDKNVLKSKNKVVYMTFWKNIFTQCIKVNFFFFEKTLFLVNFEDFFFLEKEQKQKNGQFWIKWIFHGIFIKINTAKYSLIWEDLIFNKVSIFKHFFQVFDFFFPRKYPICSWVRIFSNLRDKNKFSGLSGYQKYKVKFYEFKNSAFGNWKVSLRCGKKIK